MKKSKTPWKIQKCNKGTKTPKGDSRTFHEKECNDCDVAFIPTNGRQLYCKKCQADRYADRVLSFLEKGGYV
ncbi:MAG: hypothetical protein V3U75_01390 [Methylococcaceae bacterium]